jgi:hypothetical protein
MKLCGFDVHASTEVFRLMRTNSRMEQLIKRCNPRRGSLASALRAVVNEGLAYSEGCVLLKSQLRLTQPNVRKRFQNETGYECFVNHIHLEDILASADACVLLEQALVFADELAALKSNAGISEALEYIIICNENEANVRFHALRAEQSWLSDDLETYGEAVAAVRLPNG